MTATTTTDTSPADVWETYTASWKAASTAKRRRLWEDAVAPDCVYTDPLVRAQGYDELEAYVEQFHQQVPGGHFVTQHFTEHHGLGLAHWAMVDGGGQRIGTGTSYAEYGADGRLRRMTGFYEVPSS